MPDFVKKIKKARPDDIEPGEELIAATIGQPSGTFSRQSLGGVVGLIAAKKTADKRTASLEGADPTGLAAGIPDNQQLVIGVTDRRVLFFEQGVMSGSPKDLVAEFALADVDEISLEKHKLTYSLTIRMTDGSARLLECVRMAKPESVVTAFANAKESRAA